MATYQSNLIAKGTRHRGIYSGQEYDVAARFALPSGTVLTTSDVFWAVPVGENQVVTKVKAYAVGATGALAVSLGYFQILDGAGNPVRVERLGPLSPDNEGDFVSPVSDPDAYAAAAVLSTHRQVIVTPTTKLPGPVYFGAAVTTGATLAADVEIFLGVTIDGETSTKEVTDPYFGYNNDYLLDGA